MGIKQKLLECQQKRIYIVRFSFPEDEAHIWLHLGIKRLEDLRDLLIEDPLISEPPKNFGSKSEREYTSTLSSWIQKTLLLNDLNWSFSMDPEDGAHLCIVYDRVQVQDNGWRYNLLNDKVISLF